MKQTPLTILAFIILITTNCASQDNPPAFIKGADVSFLAEIEDVGGKFYEKGASKDALDIFKDHGFNYIRLKIWHTPRKSYNNLEKVLLMAQRAKAKGFRFLLNFHYSDWWADPQKQIKPAAWKNLAFDVLKDSVAQYTRHVVTTLKRNHALPDMVQIGNEITPGMLWDDGKVGGEFDTEQQWRKLAALIKSGVTGVQSSLDPGEKVQIMIHIDRGGDNQATRWFFDHLLAQDVKFDIIGLSFYPKWHGTFGDLKQNLHDIASRYSHDIVIVETGYPWTLKWTEREGFDRDRNIFGLESDLHPGYAASVAGQKAFLQDLIRMIKETPNQKGKGLFYWEPEWISVAGLGSHWENVALFDFNGEALESMQAFQDKNGAPFKRDINFNDDWKFKRCEPSENTPEAFKEIDYDDGAWETVTLPHTPRIEPLVVNDQWQGICWYRKNFALEKVYKEKKIFIEFEAAMQIAEVWVNGKHKTTHYGGYLPFTIDITDDVLFDKKNLIAVRLDNRDNPEVPPGKPLKVLDFCMYGGLYRNVKMHITDKLHITDAVYANKVAGGGVFVQYPLVKNDRAQLWVQTHVFNENSEQRKFKIISRLFDDEQKLIAEKASAEVSLASLEDKHVVQIMDVRTPKLWHPNSPHLYALQSLVFQDDRIVDKVVTRIGIRHISFSAKNGFMINGEKFYLRGTNRHQEYPYIGYALSDNAHYRDALKIKQAGFDFVRLSHYPHAEAFMNACDELGILAMDAIPGWQFFGNEIFQQRSFQDCRDMIRRDRNHPSVILWEVSLNESGMTKAFMDKAHRIAHQEYPGDQCHTCGWQDYAYDVFIPARQHAKAPDYWKKYDNHKPLFIAEYGDWEYYAQDAGFNQAEFKNLSPEERTSRQLRGFGEKRLLQPALNYQEAFNDNLASPAVGCANWLIFDYNRGYADDIEASGIMDIFRIPKFAYYFFKSQRPPEALATLPTESGPMLHIANYWTENSALQVKIFSNCQTVSLFLNEKEIATQNPDREVYSNNLKHPPFTFKVDGFQAGELEALGFLAGRKVASHKVRTPLKPSRLRLAAVWDGKEPKIGGKDVFFVYASIVDENGTLVPTASNPVTFELSGPGRLIGRNPMEAEAGMASILVETQGKEGMVEIGASSPDLLASEKNHIKVE